MRKNLKVVHFLSHNLGIRSFFVCYFVYSTFGCNLETVRKTQAAKMLIFYYNQIHKSIHPMHVYFLCFFYTFKHFIVSEKIKNVL